MTIISSFLCGYCKQYIFTLKNNSKKRRDLYKYKICVSLEKLKKNEDQQK